LKGKEILEACNRELDVMEKMFLKELSSKEIESMKNLIGKILKSLREDAN
jgi:DNA-binding MarR family transcriptional regulator